MHFPHVAKVTGKGKREMGLVVPARFKYMAKKKTFAKKLHKELVKKKINIVILN